MNIIKALVQMILGAMGLEVRLVHSMTASTMSGGIARAKSRGHNPATIIDVGAAEGRWTLGAMKAWPQAEYLLIEPLCERENKLKRLAARYKNLHVVSAAAGEQEGEIDLFVTEDLDGSGVADNGTGARSRKVPVTTIDKAVERLGLKAPFLIKLDTHGFEVPILNGAVTTLESTEMLVIECYGFYVAPASLLFWEQCRWLDEKGFRAIDIVDVMRRKGDRAFWQCDIVFVRKTDPCFAKNTYVI